MGNFRQRGYFLVIAVILILVIGLMGTVIVNLLANRALLSVAQQSGLSALYLAESALEIGARLLTLPSLSGTPSRFTCSSISGNAALTNAALASGTFNLTAINNAPTFAITSLSAAAAATDVVINVTSTAGFASSGKLLIDREAMDYANISGNAFVGVTRGVSGTLAASHVSGTGVGEYLCQLDAKSGIPNLTTPRYQRELQWNVQLEDGWAAGNTLSGPTRVNLVHWNLPSEMTWTQVVPTVASPQHFNGISIVSNADAWVAGNKGLILRYNGSTWTAASSGIATSIDLNSIDGVSSREAWTCSAQGDIFRWTPSAWTTSYNGSKVISSISMLDTNGDGLADVGLAVGDKASDLLYNGTSWSLINAGISTALNAVSLVSATSGWAGGAGGRIYKWSGGSSYALISTPSTTPTINGISMLSYNSVEIGWAVGTSSTAWFYNGSAWVSQSTGLAGGLTLDAVVTVSPTEAWTVSSNGRIYEWNGSTWTLMFTSAVALNAIDVLRVKTQPVSAWEQVFN